MSSVGIDALAREFPEEPEGPEPNSSDGVKSGKTGSESVIERPGLSGAIHRWSRYLRPYSRRRASGIDSKGYKHILGLWEGATENATVCKALLEDLVV